MLTDQVKHSSDLPTGGRRIDAAPFTSFAAREALCGTTLTEGIEILARAARSHPGAVLAGDDIRSSIDDVRLYRHLIRFGDRAAELCSREHPGNEDLASAIVYEQPRQLREDDFASAFAARLRALENLDALLYSPHPDDAGESDQGPSNETATLSIGGRTWYVTGLHPAASSGGHRFRYPALVFSLSEPYEVLRAASHYEQLRAIVKQRGHGIQSRPDPVT